MKLNLGCGNDIRKDYINVDFYHDSSLVTRVDLSKFPWPWDNNSADEILMLDFLEHFPYERTDDILCEVFRVLKSNAPVEIQVPDFEHCAHAMLDEFQYLCNVCGKSGKDTIIENNIKMCSGCRTPISSIAESAMKRLYGGQDSPGNFHYTAFTANSLFRKLTNIGFGDFEIVDKHHQFLNWNFKVRARKPCIQEYKW